MIPAPSYTNVFVGVGGISMDDANEDKNNNTNRIFFIFLILAMPESEGDAFPEKVERHVVSLAVQVITPVLWS